MNVLNKLIANNAIDVNFIGLVNKWANGQFQKQILIPGSLIKSREPFEKTDEELCELIKRRYRINY